MTNRLVAEFFDAEGNLVDKYVGPSNEELLELHLNHKCSLFCPICYQEACDWLEEEKEAAQNK
jgi:hypothetical protein